MFTHAHGRLSLWVPACACYETLAEKGRPWAVLCLLISQVSVPSKVLAQSRPSTSQPAAHRIEVRVHPEHFELRRGQTFDEQQLVRALAVRLRRWSLTVVSARGASGKASIWRLKVSVQLDARGRGVSATTAFYDPSGREVMQRRLPLSRYRPHDLAQILSLSTLEALIAVLDPVRFPGLTRPAEIPSSRPSSAPTSAPSSAPAVTPQRLSRKLRPPQPPWRFGLGPEFAASLGAPGGTSSIGIGINARLARHRWLAQLVVDLWSPISADDTDYRLKLWQLSAYLGAGVRHVGGSWIFALTAGGALRATRDERSGLAVTNRGDTRLSGGFGGRIQIARRITPWLALEFFVNAMGTFPSSIYTLRGVEVAEIGSFFGSSGLAVVMYL